MTKRDRQVVVTTLGAVEFAIAVVGVLNWLLTGEFSHALTVLLLIVATGSAPFIVPAFLEELNSHKLPPGKSDEPDRQKR
jgi:hypothetical protein